MNRDLFLDKPGFQNYKLAPRATALLSPCGENMAVRKLLLCHQNPGLTVGEAKDCLRRAGFESMWPDWVSQAKDSAHLTKGGMQSWIRHLFDLEKPFAQSTQK